MKETEYLNRLTQAIEFLRNKGQARTHEEIASLMAKPRPNVSAAIKGDPKRLTDGFLRRFAKVYSDYINEDWLLSGDGEMAKREKQMHPFLEAKAAAGFLGGVSIPETGDDMRDLNSFFPDYNFMIKVQGSSMEPAIYDGDVLICRILTDSLNPPENRVCVIDTKEDVLVKEIAGTKDGCLILHSYNPRYPDQRVEFSSINGIALVVGSLRTNM